MGNDILPGTLDMLILRSLTRGARHGYGIAQHLKKISEDVLDVGESSLYPALQRLLLNGWVTAEWGASENNRRARYYKLTAAGRKQLAAENREFGRMIVAIQKVMSRSEEHTSELQSLTNLVCRLLLEKKKTPHEHTIIEHHLIPDFDLKSTNSIYIHSNRTFISSSHEYYPPLHYCFNTAVRDNSILRD